MRDHHHYHHIAALNNEDDTTSTVYKVTMLLFVLFYSFDIVRGHLKAVEWAGGTIDVLVNNAGIAVLEDFMDVTAGSFDESIAVNTRAPLLVTQVTHTRMLSAARSRVLPSSFMQQWRGGSTSTRRDKRAASGVSTLC